MFIPSTFKRPVSSWKALNLRKTLLMAWSVRLKPLNCSDRKSGSAGMPRPSSYAVFCLKKKSAVGDRREQTKLFNERFGRAADQLGSDNPAVRLAGVYALAGLADDWPAGR